MATQQGTVDLKGPPLLPPEYQEIAGASIRFDKDESGDKIKLGDGGFGIVYRGEYDKLGGAKVAIKQIIGSQNGMREQDLRNLEREARNMYQVRHSDIVTVYGMVMDDAVKNDQVFAIITEYMQWGSLDDFIEKYQVPWIIRVKMLEDVSRGLAFLCTKKTVHGDIKAANILIDLNFKAKISDFGTSRLQGITTKSTKTPAQFTITHRAPEILDVKIDDQTGICDPSSKPSELSDIWRQHHTDNITTNDYDIDKSGPLAALPYPCGWTDDQLRHMIRRDMKCIFTAAQKDKIHEDCPDFLYELSKQCCKVNHLERIRFQEIHRELKEKFATYGSQYPDAMVELFNMTKAKNAWDSMDTSGLNVGTNLDDASIYPAGSSLPSMPTVGNTCVARPSAYPNSTAASECVRPTESNYPQLSDEQIRQQFIELKQTNLELIQQINVLKSQQQQLESNWHQNKNKQYTSDMEELRRRQLKKSREMIEVTQKLDELKAMQCEQRDEQRRHMTTIQIQLQQQPTKVDFKGFEQRLISDTSSSSLHGYSFTQAMLRKNSVYLLENMDDPIGLSDYLLSWDAIKPDEVEFIRSLPTRRQQVGEILQIVDVRGQDGVAKLIQALSETGQAHIAQKLEQSYRMVKLQRNAQNMMDYMRPERVISILYSQEVINRDDKEILSAEVTTSGRVAKLLDIIDRGGDRALDKFIQALSETGQAVLAENIK